MSDPKDVMGDVETTTHGPETDELGRMMEEIRVRLAVAGYELVAIVAQEDAGVVILRAPGVPFKFSQAILEALAAAGIMRATTRTPDAGT